MSLLLLLVVGGVVLVAGLAVLAWRVQAAQPAPVPPSAATAPAAAPPVVPPVPAYPSPAYRLFAVGGRGTLLWSRGDGAWDRETVPAKSGPPAPVRTSRWSRRSAPPEAPLRLPGKRGHR
ncbi:hypothetical protein WME79_25595 [Sorangium sp. So ce726]|uniref:hypothetical protein n=1 Tax=Sorangium sp. So ce726 TaxID=3133319 RepID=UPI003F644E0E